MTAGPAPVGSRWLTPARAWFLVLAAVLVAAIPLLLHWGRHQWFFLDEWSFLVNRGLGHPSTLLAPHNGHWVTVPAIAFRVLFQIFGLRYLPYEAADVVLHLCGVALIWATMRRLGVRPWLATLTAAPFAFFGAGLGNILFAFQITLTGSFVLGLAQLLLATANPPDRRKDVIGVVCGLVAIMSSAVGIPMVIGATVAAFLRRGWRAAALHGVPLAVVYVAWYLAYAVTLGTTSPSARTPSSSAGRWAGRRSSGSGRTTSSRSGSSRSRRSVSRPRSARRWSTVTARCRP